jgi:hypothetical protein
MAPEFPPQCNLRNKHDSAGQKDLVLILPAARSCSGIIVLPCR